MQNQFHSDQRTIVSFSDEQWGTYKTVRNLYIFQSIVLLVISLLSVYLFFTSSLLEAFYSVVVLLLLLFSRSEKREEIRFFGGYGCQVI